MPGEFGRGRGNDTARTHGVAVDARDHQLRERDERSELQSQAVLGPDQLGVSVVGLGAADGGAAGDLRQRRGCSCSKRAMSSRTCGTSSCGTVIIVSRGCANAASSSVRFS